MHIRKIPSPNFDERPPGARIELVVIHAISLPPGEFGTGLVADFFCNRLPLGRHPFLDKIASLRVSAHYFIDREGGVCSFVPEEKRAWHAGVSAFAGRENCNDFSLGIELEGDDEHPFTPAQYASLNLLLAAVRRRYPWIDRAHVVGHADIAPGRKTDPGPFFDWRQVRE